MAANSNAGLIGAIAAAGLAAAPAAASDELAAREVIGTGSDHSSQSVLAPIEPTMVEISRAALTGESREAVDTISSLSGSLHEWHSVPETLDRLTGTEPVRQSNPSTSSEPGETWVHDASTAMPSLAAGIAMPSAEMLRGMVDNSDHATGVGELSRVLADTLADGAAPSIDQLLEALPSHGGGGNGGLESFASQVDVGSAVWDGSLASSMEQHADFAFAHVMFHPDAPPLA